MRPLSSRGSALLTAMIALAALTILALAAISFTGKEHEVTHSFARSEELQACAETARQHLLARFRSIGAQPTQIVLSCPDTKTNPDSECIRLKDATATANQSILHTGHYGDAKAEVTGVTGVTGGIGAASGGARDLSNSLAAGATLGGQYYRVVVTCTSRGRASEVEMLVRFGI